MGFFRNMAVIEAEFCIELRESFTYPEHMGGENSKTILANYLKMT